MPKSTHKPKLYDLIKDLLTKYPITRNSDRHLIWLVWQKLGLTIDLNLRFEDYLSTPSQESITRARRKIQSNHKELQPTPLVKHYRKSIEKQKGTHIFRETI